MSSRSVTLRWLASGSYFGLALACNQILNIDEARYDARLSNLGQPAAAGTGGSGNEAGSIAGAGTSGSAGSESSQGGSHVHGNHEPLAEAGMGGEHDSNQHGSGGTNSGSAGTEHGAGPGEGGSDGEGEGGAGGMPDEPEDPCETYCSEMSTQCQGAAAQYIDENQCLRVCRIFPAGADSNAGSDAPDENSVACRLKYAKKAHYALGSEVTAYCRQAGPSGEGHCGSVCESFCSLMTTVCTAETAGAYHFASNEECLATCGALPLASVSYSTSDPLIADGNHALCRLFHVTSAAMADPEEHCEHALGVTLCEAPAL